MHSGFVQCVVVNPGGWSDAGTCVRCADAQDPLAAAPELGYVGAGLPQHGDFLQSTSAVKNQIGRFNLNCLLVPVEPVRLPLCHSVCISC